MQCHPYEIIIRTDPVDVSTSRPWRKRIRNLVRHQIESVWSIGEEGRQGDVREVFGRWAELADDRRSFEKACEDRFQVELKDTVLEPSSIRIVLEETPEGSSATTVIVSWVTKQAARTRHDQKLTSLQNLQKILKMKRNRHRPPDWDRYFQLKSNWPVKADQIMPLPDPDTVRQQKAFYTLWLEQMRSNPAMQSSQSIIAVLNNYLSLCLA